MKKLLFFVCILCLLISGCQKEAPQPLAETPSPDITDVSPATETPESTAALAAASKAYVDIIKSRDYFMKAIITGDEGINEFSVSVSPESTAMETASGDTLYTTVIKDGVTYMIDHQNKMVITSSANVASSASKMAGETISADGITFVKNDCGDFLGQTLSFDEYTTPAGDTMRFYLKEDALAGIESIQGDTSIVYEIAELSGGHHDSMHSIPAEYALVDMASLGG